MREVLLLLAIGLAVGIPAAMALGRFVVVAALRHPAARSVDRRVDDGAADAGVGRGGPDSGAPRQPHRSDPRASPRVVTASGRASGPAAALDRVVADRRVVVGQLLARRECKREARIQIVGADDLEPAVRPARVVDEAGDVPADGGVAAPAPIHPKDPDAALREIALFAPPRARRSGRVRRRSR